MVEKNVSLLPRVTGGTESVLPVPAGLSGQPERMRVKGKAEHRWDQATLGQAWFLSTVSWFLGSDSGFSYSQFIEETKESKSGKFRCRVRSSVAP